MIDKKSKACDTDKKSKPGSSNDQLGENAGEGRYEKSSSKSGKNR
jgi:hypothetical protein